MITLKQLRQGQDLISHRHIFLFKICNVIANKVQLDFDVYLPSIGKNLQRPYVWTDHQKEQLILSILKGTHIPPFAAIMTQQERPIKYQIIDGKQRLQTIIDYINGCFKIRINGKAFAYNDLPEELSYEIWSFEVLGALAYACGAFEDDMLTDQQKIDWFKLINFAGTPADLKHLKHLKELG